MSFSMKLSSLLLGVLLIGQSVIALPSHQPFRESHHHHNDLHRRQAGVIATTGAPGGVQPRFEIRQMQSKQPNQFTLLLLALQQFQAKAQSDSSSYYQISGIHGVPRQDWNGVGQCSTCKGADGYCTHDSVDFPGWHRAYMALFEQEFVSIAQSIANSWTGSNKAAMKKAASTIRWPYWDWAANPPSGDALPSVVSQATISVNGPTGKKTIPNPLYKYSFTDSSKMQYSPFTKWPTTLRYPTSDAASATTQESTQVNAFNNIRASLQDQLYQLLTTCSDFAHFSNDHAGSSSTSCANSLEGLHNTIHTTGGGVPSTTVKTVGHMFYLATAAFDPLFWLHHANVDRIFALWQTLHPDSYGATQANPHSTWTIPAGTSQDADSPLVPFYKDTSGGSFWTTNDVKDWTVFGYTYPEFSDSDGSQGAISNYVQNLYGPGATAKAGSSKREAAPEAEEDVEKRGLFPGIPDGFFGGVTASNGSTFEYVANIQAPRYALDGSYYIFVFLGEPASEDPTTWITDSSLVGPMGVLAQPGMSGTNVPISGSIPLTRALSAKLGDGPLADLTEALVAPFLKDLLSWRILGPDGTCIDPDDVPDFEISVYATTASQPSGQSCLPEWSDFIPLPLVTHGKAGGRQMFGGMIGH